MSCIFQPSGTPFPPQGLTILVTRRPYFSAIFELADRLRQDIFSYQEGTFGNQVSVAMIRIRKKNCLELSTLYNP